MTVNFDIFPRQALAPSDFKALGRSLRRWLRLHAKQQGSVHWYDSDSLYELLKGAPPLLVEAESEASPSERGSRRSGSAASGHQASGVAVLDALDSTPPPFCLSLVYNKIIDDRQILANVRRALSTDLVADVLVNGRSWDHPTHP